MTVDDRDDKREAERIRLLEFQLDYLRAELLHLSHERDRLTYSASGHLYRFVRPVEACIADAATRIIATLRGRTRRADAPCGAAPPVATAVHIARPAARLLVDVTGTIKRDAGTGIQRVVKEVVRALYRGAPFTLPARAVRCEKGRLYSANAFVASLIGGDPAPDEEVAIEPGDRFFGLSDSWNAFDELGDIFARVRADGGEIVTCIFDLIPELYPHACHEATVPRYRAWLRRALIESDAFLAISRTVADELADYVDSHKPPHRAGLKIGWFHCGADLPAPATETPREKIIAAASGGAPVFLAVGTIEPRKGQRVALQAFDALWAKSVDAKLIIVGRRGWFEEAVATEILTHPEFGRRLYWFEDADDGELAFLYDHAAALIFASYAEGFGLPMVEAARHGRPVICSDIPVFREVGREGAMFFRVNDPQALAKAVTDFLGGARRADARIMQESWADAARRIVEVVAHEAWSRRLA